MRIYPTKIFSGWPSKLLVSNKLINFSICLFEHSNLRPRDLKQTFSYMQGSQPDLLTCKWCAFLYLFSHTSHHVATNSKFDYIVNISKIIDHRFLTENSGKRQPSNYGIKENTLGLCLHDYIVLWGGKYRVVNYHISLLWRKMKIYRNQIMDNPSRIIRRQWLSCYMAQGHIPVLEWIIRWKSTMMYRRGRDIVRCV